MTFRRFFLLRTNRMPLSASILLSFLAMTVLSGISFAQENPELARTAMNAAVWVEKLDANGNAVKRSSGFVVKGGRVATSFRSIDGAASLKLIFVDGKELKTDQISGANRYQDWALIAIDDNPRASLAVLPKKNSVSDHCYWLEVKPDGTRVLVEGQITGVAGSRPWGERLTLSGKYSYAALGGPVLDEKGQVIGMLGGALPEAYVRQPASTAASVPASAAASVPPASADASGASLHPPDAEDVYEVANGVAIPSSLIPQTLLAAPRTLKVFLDNGEMTPLVTNSKYVQSGMTTSKENVKKKPAERAPSVDFKKSAGTAAVIIAFNAMEALKTTAQIKLFDFENHPVAAGEVEKVSVKKGSAAERNWDIPVSDLPPGIYRVDILIGDGVAWREYFRVTE